MESQSIEIRRRLLKIAIVDRGLTQRRVSRLSRIEYTRLSKIINSILDPIPRERRALARVLARTEEELFGRPRPADDAGARSDDPGDDHRDDQ